MKSRDSTHMYLLDQKREKGLCIINLTPIVCGLVSGVLELPVPLRQLISRIMGVVRVSPLIQIYTLFCKKALFLINHYTRVCTIP